MATLDVPQCEVTQKTVRKKVKNNVDNIFQAIFNYVRSTLSSRNIVEGQEGLFSIFNATKAGLNCMK